MSILEGSVTGSVAGTLQLNGEGGTDNYNELINKPQINGVTLLGNKDSADLNIISDVQVNDVSCVDPDNVARITIPPAPNVPVQDVTVNGTSCMVGTTAEITIPPAPEVPVQDVEVNGSSVVIGGVAEINIPPTPTIPVTDVEVNNASVVSGTVAEINIPVLDVKVDGASVVDLNGDANITLPEVPVQDVEVDGTSVVDSDGIAQITLPTVPVHDVEVDGASVVDSDGIAQITLPVIPSIPVTDVEVNGSSVMSGTVANIVLVAGDVSYDNSNSGYTASQTQAAIDEAASNISNNASDISDLQTNVGDFSTPLDTTAQDCHDAINELKGTLDNRGVWAELLGSTSTVGTHTLADSYRNYKSIMIVLFMSGSKIISQVCPSNFLLSAGYKMYVQSGSDACLVSFPDNTTANIESTTQSIRIYGQK